MGEVKKVGALLNGLIRQVYYADEDVTNEFLKSEIFPDIADDEFSLLMNKYRGILKSMASTNMDLAQADIFLNSQSKKKDSGITPDHVKAILKCWKNNKDKIHENLVNKSMWQSQLKNFSWRVDIQNRSRHNDQIDTPTAIVEMTLGSRQDNDQDEIVQFELTEESASKLLSGIKDIDKQLQKYAKTSS